MATFSLSEVLVVLFKNLVGTVISYAQSVLSQVVAPVAGTMLKAITERITSTLAGTQLAHQGAGATDCSRQCVCELDVPDFVLMSIFERLDPREQVALTACVNR